MLTNSQMKEGRFAQWAKYRKAVRFVQENVAAGRTVYLCGTGVSKPCKITKKTVDLVFARKNGLYVQHGKRAVCFMDRAVPCRIVAE